MKTMTAAWMYILLLALLLQLFLPWWSVALAAAAIGAWLGQKGFQTFIAGFAGIGLLWLMASARIHVANDGVLSARIVEMMSLPNAFSLILITALCGALVGGLAALTGFYIRTVFD